MSREVSSSSMDALYEKLIDCWISALPEVIPAKLRLATERIARCIAAEVCLASMSIVYTDGETNIAEPLPSIEAHESIDLGNVITLPVRGPNKDRTARQARLSPASMLASGSKSPGHSDISLVHELGEGSFPTPTATSSTKSGTTFFSQSSDFQQLRLESLTKYSGTVQHVQLSQRQAHCLNHWAVGADPDKYDWLATRQKLEQLASAEDGAMTPLKRRRLQRRAEKLLKKQRREAALAAVDTATPYRGPSLVRFPAWRSSPALMDEVPSSQMVSSQPVIASQTVEGRHGGRPPLNQRAAKKRKRTIGF
jgi:RNA polymerase I-specific transcription initiation factor RRN6